MLSVNLLVLQLLIVITNGQNNPFFICQRRAASKNLTNAEAETYDIVISRSDEMVISDCENLTLVEEIVAEIVRSAPLRGRPLTIYVKEGAAGVGADRHLNIAHLKNASDLDLSGNRMAAAKLENFPLLRNLNLTNNKIRSLTAINLGRNVALTSLDVSRNRLLKFEYLSIPRAEKLYVRSNNIFELDANIVLPAFLVELDLTRNEIENLTAVQFRSNSLKVLNLSINLINALSRATIQCLPRLQTLILECNKIFEIESGTFSANVQLTELNLRDNNLSSLKKGVFDALVNLQTLDISKNNLLQLTPDTLQNLNNLMDISLSENGKLCDSHCKRNFEFLLVLGGRLKTLKMDRLRLRKFPMTLTTSVRQLDLSKNKLNTVQIGSLENFPYLEALTLTGNEIELAEEDVFGKMEFLLELRLDDNKLKRVPRSMPDSLRRLRLDRNRIRAVEKADFRGLRNLRLLKLNANLIQSIDSGSFATLKTLHTLDVSDNPILKLSANAFDGSLALHTFLASGLAKVKVNATDIRYFPFSELPYLRTLNLSASVELANAFLLDLPLLATVKQLETLDLSYGNLTVEPHQLQYYLTRLQVLRLHDNPLNCTRNWFRSKEFQFRQLLPTPPPPPPPPPPLAAPSEPARLRVRIAPSPRRSLLLSTNHDCVLRKFENLNVPKEQFWSSVRRATASKPAAAAAAAATTTTAAATAAANHGNLSSTVIDFLSTAAAAAAAATTTVDNGSPAHRTLSAVGKKFNTRSLHIAQFANQNVNQTNQTNVDNSSTTITTEIKLPVNVPTTTTIPITITSILISRTSDVASTILDPSPTSEINVTLVNNATEMEDQNSNTIEEGDQTTMLTTTTTTASEREKEEEEEEEVPTTSPSTAGPTSPSTTITMRTTTTSFRAKKNDFHASAISAPAPAPAAVATQKSHYESLVWNQTDDNGSFFDWFPGQNDSSANSAGAAAASAAAIGSDSAAEHSIKANDNVIEYTHPGVVIFSAISCFLVVVFASVFAPPYVQKYKWRRQRYKMSQLDNECQRSIEISSISAFVETEIPLE